MFDLPPDAVGSEDTERIKKVSNNGNGRLKYKKNRLFVKLQSKMNSKLLFYPGLCHVQQILPLHGRQESLTVFAMPLMEGIVSHSKSK